MKQEFNLAFNAFAVITSEFDLLGNIAVENKKSIEDFEKAFEKAFPKRYRKAKKFKRKVDDLTTEYCEELFDVNIFCQDCPIGGTLCEGSNCGNQMEGYFSSLTRNEFSKKLFEIFGDRFYSFSRRMKNELLKN